MRFSENLGWEIIKLCQQIGSNITNDNVCT